MTRPDLRVALISLLFLLASLVLQTLFWHAICVIKRPVSRDHVQFLEMMSSFYNVCGVPYIVLAKLDDGHIEVRKTVTHLEGCRS